MGLGDVGKLAIMSSALSTVFVDKSLSLSGGGDFEDHFQTFQRSMICCH